MATNEFEQPATTPPFAVTVVQAAHDVTGTDARLTLRLLFALLAVAIAGSSTPWPYSVVLLVALVILIVEVARLAWKR
jgi:hypothetical protein